MQPKFCHLLENKYESIPKNAFSRKRPFLCCFVNQIFVGVCRRLLFPKSRTIWLKSVKKVLNQVMQLGVEDFALFAKGLQKRLKYVDFQSKSDKTKCFIRFCKKGDFKK
jgi:hypothetical protein